MHLRGNRLLETIDSSKTVSDEKKAKAMIFLRHHIHDGLKDEYITKEDPCDLWKSLKERFDHQKYVILPKAKHEWIHLRFQDYKSVSEFNSAMFGITSRMMLCGEKISDYDMIEKNLSTFHPENVILQQQYRVNGYTRYSELMQVLLVEEQNNQLVTLNHQARPTGSAPFPEANVASSSYDNKVVDVVETVIMVVEEDGEEDSVPLMKEIIKTSTKMKGMKRARMIKGKRERFATDTA
ncbi:uncharacterized protein LOC106389329 [Brassica napus]|uniref:uncharacterized protein LOC106389329 n=1 Tax=Brassica napus TaxID=3708 RepID=UPI002078F114|nr:uncharacterized protein LOC106389329 [Brassica napus]